MSSQAQHKRQEAEAPQSPQKRRSQSRRRCEQQVRARASRLTPSLCPKGSYGARWRPLSRLAWRMRPFPCTGAGFSVSAGPYRIVQLW